MTRIQAQITANGISHSESAVNFMIPRIHQEVNTRFTIENLPINLSVITSAALAFLHKTSEQIALSLRKTFVKVTRWTACIKRYVLSDEMDWVGCISFLTLTAAAIILNFII